MWRRPLLSLTAASLGCCNGASAKEAPPPIAGHGALRHGWPATDRVRSSGDFVVCYDFRTRNPRWVAERLTPESLRGGAAAGGGPPCRKFKEPSDVAARLRPRLFHYKNSGYDRGHLAPAADHRGDASSYVLDNVSPQRAALNRDGWARLERLVRSVAARSEDVVVVTGPLFLPEIRRGGGGLGMGNDVLGAAPCVTHVPTHFFKIVVAENAGSYAIGCFVLPNEAVGAGADLLDYCVPLANLEAAAGLVPFPDLLTPRRRAALVAAEARWLGGGTPAVRDYAADRVPAGDRAADVAHLCDGALPRHLLRPPGT